LLGALVLLTLLSESYVRRRTREPALFYALLLFLAGGALLLSASTDTIMLLVAVELVSVAGYVMTGFLHPDRRSTEAAMKVMVYGAVLTAVMAFGLSWLYGLTGTTDYVVTAEVLSGLWAWTPAPAVQPAVLYPVLVLILVGLALKIGSAPLDQWLPDVSGTHEVSGTPDASGTPGGYAGAPAAVAASLAILPKIAGLAALVRVTMVMLPGALDLGAAWRWPLVGMLAVVAMLAGSLLGLGQTQFKRLMAYSGIAQVGYVLVAVAVASEASLSALLIILVAYTLAELGVFAAITVVSGQTESDRVTAYRGLHRRAPVLAAVLMISLLSLSGLPGTGGFIAKLWLFIATFRAGHVGLLILAALSTVISLGTYWKVIRAVVMHPDEGLAPLHVPAAATVVIIAAVAGLLVVGILPNPLLRWAQAAVHVFFAPG
jgi:NADH-quinone oxidoreductase subunit N